MATSEQTRVPSSHPTLPEILRAIIARRVFGLPAWVVLTQLFIGLGWLRAAAEKLIDPQWWSGDGVTGFLAENNDAAIGWYQPLADLVLVPLAPVVAALVVVAQLGIGTFLIARRHTGAALAAGMFLNLNFMAAGAVNPSAFYLLSQGAVMLWLAERHRSRESIRLLGVAASAAAVLGGLSLPFISTLHPEHVIEDPAVMFVTGGVLTVIGCHLVEHPVQLRRVRV